MLPVYFSRLEHFKAPVSGVQSPVFYSKCHVLHTDVFIRHFYARMTVQLDVPWRIFRPLVTLEG